MIQGEMVSPNLERPKKGLCVVDAFGWSTFWKLTISPKQ
jgi:hypothetical protein